MRELVTRLALRPPRAPPTMVNASQRPKEVAGLGCAITAFAPAFAFAHGPHNLRMIGSVANTLLDLVQLA
jgi:hypothetical protein